MLDKTQQGATGLSLNGLSPSGLSLNGLSTNGLSLNGLSLNGFATESFSTWFNAHPAEHSDMVMRYVVSCAVPAGESRKWTNPTTLDTYTWPGQLGLTPDWAAGQPATEVEQQVITACLAALVNKYGVHVPLYLLGETAQGVQLPVQEEELETFSEEEGAFFGNLFQGDGAFACQSPTFVSPPHEKMLRACALLHPGQEAECAPLQVVGHCNGELKCERDTSQTYLRTCHYQGKTYRTLTTRLRSQDIRPICEGSSRQQAQ
ncbi:hypothetical protein [Archangium sp.]|uniref:hypothetical protein n=1 Tax=Archangium sp. TaxID=1872627 RepID=UPI002D4BE79E|nr:hypothetical protein [Archangium sp.]HYO59041.1 hypothetical protein [Archangium sp.]